MISLFLSTAKEMCTDVNFMCDAFWICVCITYWIQCVRLSVECEEPISTKEEKQQLDRVKRVQRLWVCTFFLGYHLKLFGESARNAQ